MCTVAHSSDDGGRNLPANSFYDSKLGMKQYTAMSRILPFLSVRKWTLIAHFIMVNHEEPMKWSLEEEFFKSLCIATCLLLCIEPWNRDDGIFLWVSWIFFWLFVQSKRMSDYYFFHQRIALTTTQNIFAVKFFRTFMRFSN